MKTPGIMALTCGLALALVAVAGCNRPSPPPTALPVAELPAAVEKAFNKASPEVKGLAAQVVAFVQAQDYSKAFLAVQNLASRPGLTKEQLNVMSRATLTLNDLLQSAQTQGDQKAAQTLKSYRIDK